MTDWTTDKAWAISCFLDRAGHAAELYCDRLEHEYGPFPTLTTLDIASAYEQFFSEPLPLRPIGELAH